MRDLGIDVRPSALNFKLPGTGARNECDEINRARRRAPVEGARVSSSLA